MVAVDVVDLIGRSRVRSAVADVTPVAVTLEHRTTRPAMAPTVRLATRISSPRDPQIRGEGPPFVVGPWE